ncbi:MAG: hypothetical protein JJU12_04860 [Chlamydiales bacterium]|nr:hypothetical protein [Chlamydiales bacterium]
MCAEPSKRLVKSAEEAYKTLTEVKIRTSAHMGHIYSQKSLSEMAKEHIVATQKLRAAVQEAQLEQKPVSERTFALLNECNEKVKELAGVVNNAEFVELVLPRGPALRGREWGKESVFSELFSERPSFVNFNRKADDLKNDVDWHFQLAEQVKTLTDREIVKLASMDERDLRGYDREVMQQVMIFVKQKIERLQLPELKGLSERLDRIILNLQTYIIKGELKQLGSGAVNKVYKVAYFEEGKRVEGVFKPDPTELDAGVRFKEQLFGTAAASGIPPGIDAHLPSRAVASSVVDRLLYKDETISVRTRFAIVNGQRGILMDKAAGKSPLAKKMNTRERINLNDLPQVRQFMIKILKEKEGKIGLQDLKLIAAMTHYREVKIEGDLLSGKWILTGIPVAFERFSPNNSTTAEGLLKLQVKDFITGECDRHPQNYFIDDEGKVRGIDEDCCFGVNAVPKDRDVRLQRSLKGFIPNNASLMLRMPPVVTKKIQNEINDLRNSAERLIESLHPFISEDEIGATLRRLEMLDDHINSSSCLVVEDSDGLLSPKAKEKIDSNNSYWARELFVFSSDEKGWNYLRAHRRI